MAKELAADTIGFGPFELHLTERLLLRDGASIQIGDRGLELLAVLLERPGQIYSRAELSLRVWHKAWVEDVNLRVAVAALRKTLGLTTDGRDYITTVHGRGYAFSPAVQLTRQTGTKRREETCDIATSTAVQGQAPTLLFRPIGRDEEIVSLRALLHRHRLVTVVGLGGIGKTTLALRTAELAREAGEEVRFVDLTAIGQPDEIAARIAFCLGAHRTIQTPHDWLQASFRGLNCLLILDNCEHLTEATATLCETLLGSAPGLRILATSREPLRAECEAVLRIDGLATPEATDAIGATRVLEYAAVRLFVERMRAAIPGFTLDDQGAAMIAEICRRLDGIPLALCLGASRIPAFGIAGVAAHLDDRFRLLTKGLRTAQLRQQTLLAAFEWSYSLLTPHERQVFSRLAVFVCEFTLADARDVAGFAGIAADDVPALVGDLVDKSLVQFCVHAPEPRYRLLETTRAFATGQLSTCDDAETIRRRHADLVLRKITAFGSSGASCSDAIPALRLADELRSALEWAFLAQHSHALALQLTSASIRLLMHLGLTFEAEKWIDRALAIEVVPQGRLGLLNGLATAILFSHGNEALQARLYGDACQLAAAIDDEEGELQALWGLLMTNWTARHIRKSLEAAERLHNLALSRGRIDDVMASEVLIGAAWHALNNQPRAARHLENVIAHYADTAPTENVHRLMFDQRAVALSYRACVERMAGMIDTARATAATAVAQAESGGHAPTIFVVLSNACPLEIDIGDRAMAQRYIDSLIRHCGHHPGWRTYAEALQDVWQIGSDEPAPALIRLRSMLEGPDTQVLANFHLWLGAKLANGFLAIGDAEAAKSIVDRVIRAAHRNEDNWLLPELLALQRQLSAPLAGDA